MAAKFRVIIDASGLPEAASYYREFPREPSPAGEMAISMAAMAALTNLTFAGVLDQMATVAGGGTVLLVCHGVSDGFLITLSSSGGKFAQTEALKLIMDTAPIDDEAAEIRKLPQKTDDEKKAKIARWKEFFTRRKVANITGELFTLQEAEATYADWLKGRARLLGIDSAALLALIKKMKAVQARKLKRVEVRACHVGKSKDAMRVFKKFFGCEQFLAPTATTFYLPPVFVDSVSAWPSIVHWDPTHPQRVKELQFRDGGRVLGREASKEMMTKFVKTGKERVFLTRHSAVVLRICEISAFKFIGIAAAGRPLTRPQRTLDPDWPYVAGFVGEFIMPRTAYRRGPFRAAGFWEPSVDGLPWVLPNEPQYLKVIQSV